MYLLGIDIGGTKISVCIGDKNGNLIDEERFFTQPLKGSKNAVKKMIETAEKLIKKNKISINAIGISSPGPISLEKKMILNPPNLPGWENTPIIDIFEKAFNLPVLMNNDANAAILAEYEFGGAKGTPNMLYLTVSTGMGGGIIVDHKLVQGITDTAGEIGHFILDVNGPPCPCGLKGCFEAFCGGANLAKKMRREIQNGSVKTDLLKIVNKKVEDIDIECLIQGVKKKDPYALELWEMFSMRLAQGIGTLIMTLNPEAIILGTIAIHAKELLLSRVRHHLPKFAWRHAIEACTISPSILGDRISELSALALAVRALKND